MRLKDFLKRMGPGVISGASDDDPSAIGTFAQAGAKYGYMLLWTMIYSYPFKSVVQEISARIARVTGQGLARNMITHYPKAPAYIIVGLIIAANIFNIAADIAIMGDAVKLLIGGNALLHSAGLVIISVLLQIFIPYSKYVNILKWLSLALFAYIAAAFVMDISWSNVLRDSFIPDFSLNADFLKMVVAIAGATISPYLLFWQADQETEEIEMRNEDSPLAETPEQAPDQFGRIKADTYTGMAMSNIVAFFVILVTAAALSGAGQHTIKDASEAAGALKPLGGKLSTVLFSLGIIGTGLLALPVLSGSCAYALGQIFHWRVGLEKKPSGAKAFYGVLALAAFIGLFLNLINFNVFEALFWATAINGIVCAPVIIFMMLISSNKIIMGDFTLPSYLKLIGWMTAGVMIAATMTLIVSWAL